eukprot:TRINITY_DN27643_c0_g1_i1.p1 TRINITY_DN27643_c0_g1~~TRINITY_DN27643_c0_g1_i1.p1  ORF type:complete len:297 (+),score=48.85 TRINITY_DN27643_c0_g1_i1:68-958(+)
MTKEELYKDWGSTLTSFKSSLVSLVTDVPKEARAPKQVIRSANDTYKAAQALYNADATQENTYDVLQACIRAALDVSYAMEATAIAAVEGFYSVAANRNITKKTPGCDTEILAILSIIELVTKWAEMFSTFGEIDPQKPLMTSDVLESICYRTASLRYMYAHSVYDSEENDISLIAPPVVGLANVEFLQSAIEDYEMLPTIRQMSPEDIASTPETAHLVALVKEGVFGTAHLLAVAYRGELGFWVARMLEGDARNEEKKNAIEALQKYIRLVSSIPELKQWQTSRCRKFLEATEKL